MKDEGILDNHITSLTHDGNDEINVDMEETSDVVPVKEEKVQQVSLLGYVTSNFVATNNEDFKILKDMVDFYLHYKKTGNTMQMQSNYIK